MAGVAQVTCNEEFTIVSQGTDEEVAQTVFHPGYRPDGLREDLGGFETVDEYKKYLRISVFGMDR